MFDLNKVFIGSMIVSVTGTVAFTLLQSHPLVILAAGLLPLTFYFIKLMSLAKSGVTQTTVDSIYYFGFIVTIASLAASVLSVAFYGIDRDINLLIAQFGVGLLATGLALVFRMVLIAKIESLNKKDLSETIEEYVRKIDHVVSQVESSAASFEALSKNLIERTEKECLSTHDHFKASMLASSQLFSNQIGIMLNNFSQESTLAIKNITQSANEFYTLVQSIKLDQHVADINTNTSAISNGLKTFSNKIASFTEQTQSELRTIIQDSITKTLDGLDESIQQSTNKTTDMLNKAQLELQKIDFYTENMAIKTELSSLAKYINSYTKKISNKDEQIESTLENLLQNIQSVSQSLSASDLNKKTESIQNNFTKLANDTAILTDQVNALSQSIKDQTNNNIEKIIVSSTEQILSNWKNHTDQIAKNIDEKLPTLLGSSINSSQVNNSFNSLISEINMTNKASESIRENLKELNHQNFEETSERAKNINQEFKNIYNRFSKQNGKL